MVTVLPAPLTAETFAELLEQLGDIPPGRIRLHSPPGTATEEDVLAARRSPERRLCELVNGTLVEKAMGVKESWLAGVIIQLLNNFLDRHDLGFALPPDGMLRLWPGRVRIPDVSFISRDQVPAHEIPDDPIPELWPDLAVEVVSRGNTKKEIARKLHDYFAAGTRLVWVVQPKTQTVEVYTSATKKRRLAKDQALSGGTVLPGFTLPLAKLFGPRNRRKAGR